MNFGYVTVNGVNSNVIFWNVSIVWFTDLTNYKNEVFEKKQIWTNLSDRFIRTFQKWTCGIKQHRGTK